MPICGRGLIALQRRLSSRTEFLCGQAAEAGDDVEGRGHDFRAKGTGEGITEMAEIWPRSITIHFHLLR